MFQAVVDFKAEDGTCLYHYLNVVKHDKTVIRKSKYLHLLGDPEASK